MGHRPHDRQPQHDLDSTDELPILDEARAAATEDDRSATGAWPALAGAGLDEEVEDPSSTTGEWPPLEGSEDGAAAPAEEAIAALTTALREKSFAIARLERELEAARAAAQRQVGGLPAELAILAQRLADAERQRLALASQHDQRRAQLAAAEEALAAERTRHEVLEAAAQVRLAECEAALLEAETRLSTESMRAGALQAEVGRLSAELRRVRTELREARRHADRLLEQLRSREALGRYGEDFRAADAAPRHPPADPRPGEFAPLCPEPAVAPAGAAATAPSGRAVLPKRYLVRLDDPVAPLQVLGQERIRVGRTPDNDLRLDEDWMSRHHATLRLGSDATVVEDAGSTNGVFVNGRRVRRELLRDGDELAFGKARFRFQVHRPGGARD